VWCSGFAFARALCLVSRRSGGFILRYFSSDGYSLPLCQVGKMQTRYGEAPPRGATFVGNVDHKPWPLDKRGLTSCPPFWIAHSPSAVHVQAALLRSSSLYTSALLVRTDAAEARPSAFNNLSGTGLRGCRSIDANGRDSRQASLT